MTEYYDPKCQVDIPSAKRRCRRTRPLSKSEKEMVLNAYKTELQNLPYTAINDIVDIVAYTTGVSERSIFRIIKEYKGNRKLSSPKILKPRTKLLDSIDSIERNAIRKIVHTLMIQNGLSTLDNVLKAVNADPHLPDFKRSTLYKLLKDLNFKYVKYGNNSMLTDKNDIVLWRRRFLRSIRSMRQQGKKIYYTDETWVKADQRNSSSKQQFLSGTTVSKSSPCKGTRLIIAHIGSDSGFVDDSLLLCESKKAGDHHEDMNSQVFEEWFMKVLPKLEENSVIVISDAPHHNRKLETVPTTASNKKYIMEWLQSKKISYDEDMLKSELLEIVYSHKHRYNTCVIDEIAKSANITVLRVPPFHSELNAVQFIWAIVKNDVIKNNSNLKKFGAKNLLIEAISRIVANDWRQCIDHVVTNVETQMWNLDNIIEEKEEEFISSLEDSNHGDTKVGAHMCNISSFNAEKQEALSIKIEEISCSSEDSLHTVPKVETQVWVHDNITEEKIIKMEEFTSSSEHKTDLF